MSIFKKFVTSKTSSEKKMADDLFFLKEASTTINLSPEKFFILSALEINKELPTLEDLSQLFQLIFPNLSEINSSLLFDYYLTTSSDTWNKEINKNKIEVLFAEFNNLFDRQSHQEQKYFYERIMYALVLIKELNDLATVRKNLIYRLSVLESYQKITKAEFIQISENTKNIINNNMHKVESEDSTLGNSFQISEKKEQSKNSTKINDEIPHYLKSALDELETAKSNCKKSFQLFQIEAESLIKKASISGNDKESIKKITNHGFHGNFNMIDMNALSKTTTKYLFPLEMNFKGKFKSTESDFLLAKKKFDAAREKVEKIKSKVNR
jgi:hypothetical protein